MTENEDRSATANMAKGSVLTLKQRRRALVALVQRHLDAGEPYVAQDRLLYGVTAAHTMPGIATGWMDALKSYRAAADCVSDDMPSEERRAVITSALDIWVEDARNLTK